MNGDEAAVIINKLVQEANKGKKNDQLEIICNIVACTANTTTYWTNLAKNSGMVHMINKPLTPLKLDDILEKWFYD